MAIIKLGSLVVGIRGTAGGLTYSGNSAGPYVKTWSRASNRRTPRQQTQRVIVSSMAEAWQGATQSERDAWDAFAADPAQEKTNSLGEPYYSTGWGWFVALNSNRLNTGQTVQVTAPTSAAPTSPATLAGAAYYDANTCVVLPDSTEFEADSFAAIFCYQGRSFARTASGKRAFFGCHVRSAAPWIIDVSAYMVSRFGGVFENRRYFFEVYQQRGSNGFRGLPNTFIIDSELEP